MKISHRLWFISGLSFVVFIAAIGIGWTDLKSSTDSLARVFAERVVPMQNLAFMQKAILNNCADVLRGYEHDTTGTQWELHQEHDITEHTIRIEQRLVLIDTMLGNYLASTGMAAEERELAVDLEKNYRLWHGHFSAAYADLQAKTYSHQVLANFIKANDNELNKLNEGFDGLIGLQTRIAKQEYDAAEAAFYRNQILFGGLLVIGVLGVFGTAALTIRRISLSLEKAGRIAEAVASGDLSFKIEVSGRDELSDLMRKLSQMQSNLGTLVTLIDAIGGIVHAADQGDLSGRVETNGLQGFAEDIAMSLNQLLEITDTSLHEICRISRALAAGDLSQKVEQDFPGTFGETAAAVNATVAALNQVVAEVRDVVNASSQGDFSRLVAVEDKQGYAKTLAELLNTLSTTANEALFDISRVAKSLAAGDLTQIVGIDYPGLFGETASGINITVENLREVISNVVMTVNDITDDAEKISNGSGDLSRHVQGQATSLVQTTASMEGITEMAQQNAQGATQVNDLAQVASETAKNSGVVVKTLADTMLQIQASSGKIADIISVIDQIAFQTNILALNAAVEAARAGEHGRGFAVVASEVRFLAQRSAAAAKEISGLIADSSQKVERGMQQTKQAGDAMDNLLSSIASVATIANNISKASIEQSEGIMQVNLAVMEIDKATQENILLVNGAADAAASLEDQAQQLQQLVANFRLAVDNEEEIDFYAIAGQQFG